MRFADLTHDARRCFRQQSGKIRHAALDNTGLLASDFLECLTQNFRMIKTDVGYDCQCGMKDIGGVETTAKSGFYDGDIDLLTGEIVK